MNPVPFVLSAALPPDCRATAALLNRGCVCSSVDHERLRIALQSGAGGVGAAPARGLALHPNLFSATSVYVAETHLDCMAELIRVVDRVVALPAWHERVLAYAPPIARFVPQAKCAFLGYDFHLGADGPRLIEINTNAGGLLGAKLMRAQRVCCTPMPALPAAAPEDRFVAMFREEWRLTRGDVPLTSVAIVDQAPASQFLAAGFEHFRQLFESAGISALIADPSALAFDTPAVTRYSESPYNRVSPGGAQTGSGWLRHFRWFQTAIRSSILLPQPAPGRLSCFFPPE